MDRAMKQQRTITIAETTYKNLEHRTLSGRPFIPTGVKNSDGTYTLPIDEEVYCRMQELMATGQTADDVILALFRK